MLFFTKKSHDCNFYFNYISNIYSGTVIIYNYIYVFSKKIHN